MKYLLSMAILLIASTASAEPWVCYDSTTYGGVTYNKPKAVAGDCKSLGICTGPNYNGLDANCFLATKAEFDKAKESLVEAVPANAEGNRVVDLSQSDKDAIAAQKATDAELAEEQTAKDYLTLTSMKSMLGIIMDEINLLRAEHGLAQRTWTQFKNAIDARIEQEVSQ